MKATAVANANIALVKYWGKRNKELMLPHNGSISMTCEGLNTTTTVEFGDYKRDVLVLNGKGFEHGKEYEGVTEFLNIVREMASIDKRAKVVSKNNFPTAAGLASSSSGFAALALASSRAAGLNLSKKELTQLARRGSGSASRSVCEGFVEWYRGEKEDGSDCYAETIAKKDHWPDFRIIAVVTSKKEKKTKSRAGMAQTVATSPFYSAWLSTVNQDLEVIRKGIKEMDFSMVGKQAEFNCLKMHATMITTLPPILYWNPATVEIIHSVMEWRDQGLECYFTIDAGPQVKIICLEKDIESILKRVEMLSGVEEVLISKPGDGVKLSDEHLF